MKKPLSMALEMAKKAGAQKMAHGGKTCYACGGVVAPKEDQAQKLSMGGEVDDDFGSDFASDMDDDADDLVSSPGVPEGEMDNTTSSPGEQDHNAFLRAYLIHRKVGRG